MTKEKLDTLLANGAITQEEYDGLVQSIQQPAEPPEDEPQPEALSINEEQLEKMIQSKVDKITSKLGKEKADLQKQLEKLKKERLSADEIKQMELSEKTKEIEERELRLKEQENRLYAIKAIKAAGLDDGSDKSLALVDFVLGGDEADIDEKVKAFSALVKSFVKTEVDKTFKSNGREPANGSGGSGGVNPYAEGSYNLTQQMKLEVENPELAKTLKAAAGVK